MSARGIHSRVLRHSFKTGGTDGEGDHLPKFILELWALVRLWTHTFVGGIFNSQAKSKKTAFTPLPTRKENMLSFFAVFHDLNTSRSV